MPLSHSASTNSNKNMKNTSILLLASHWSISHFLYNRTTIWWIFCFQVNKYLENYERALSGFEGAALKDPGLNATDEVQKLVNLLDKLENMLRVMHLFVNAVIWQISIYINPVFWVVWVICCVKYFSSLPRFLVFQTICLWDYGNKFRIRIPYSLKEIVDSKLMWIRTIPCIKQLEKSTY